MPRWTRAAPPRRAAGPDALEVADEDLKPQDAERVDVVLRRRQLAAKLLRRRIRIVHGPRDAAAPRSQPEVGEMAIEAPRLARRHQQIRGPQIAMHDRRIELVKLSEQVGELLDQVGDLPGIGLHMLRPPVEQQPFEIGGRHVGVLQARRIELGENLLQRRDPRHRSAAEDLAQERIVGILKELLGPAMEDEVEHDRRLVLQAPRLPDFSVGPLFEQLLQLPLSHGPRPIARLEARHPRRQHRLEFFRRRRTRRHRHRLACRIAGSPADPANRARQQVEEAAQEGAELVGRLACCT